MPCWTSPAWTGLRGIRWSGAVGRASSSRRFFPYCRIAPKRSYRTAVGAEIDLLLDRPDGTLWAIEVKRGLAAKPKRGFSIACEDLSPSRAFIVYSGEARYPVAALGVREMAGMLARSSPQAPDKVSSSPP